MSQELQTPPARKQFLKRFKKIPIYVVEEHNDALQFIYSAIGGKKLPVEGTALLHFDAHPDMLIDRKLKGIDVRAGKKLLPLLQIENWIVPAVAAGHIGRVVWLRPPWAKQFSDGTRVIRVGDHPETGLLRLDSTEPYYLSDALYSSNLVNERTFTFTVAELSDVDESITQKLINELNNLVCEPYVLDIDLDFFSTGNPFLNLYNNIGLYDLLEPIFGFELPNKGNKEDFEKALEMRVHQLQELESIFQHLEDHGSLEAYTGEETKMFRMVSDVAAKVITEASRLGETPDWWAVYAAGCTRDQGGLPYYINNEEDIRKYVRGSFTNLLKFLPKPTLITIARSTDDGYCPPHQVEFIQSLVLQTLKSLYDSEEPTLYYLNQ